jgi:hypothetical protein
MSKVFKHRNFNENTLSVLCNNELWFSSPKLFNDPFDGQLDVEVLLEKFFNSQKSTIAQKDKDAIFEYCRKNNLIYYGMAILSLNQSNSDIIVWSHYADEHRGICFEFTLEGLRKDFWKNPYNVDADVNYELNPIDILNQLSFNDDGNIDGVRLTASIIRALWESKHKNWEYEGEIRFFHQDEKIYEGKNGIAKKFDPNNLTSIYYGIRTPKTTKQCIHALLKDERYTHVKEYQMNRELGEFKLYPDENVDYSVTGDGYEK